MLISPKVTDTIYQAVIHLLIQQGVEVNEPLQQRVLLRDGMFHGYRFQTTSLHIDWLAQHGVLVLRNKEGRILLQEQLLYRKTNVSEMSSKSEHRQAVA